MELEDITTIGVVGAGQMGRGISQVCATAGYHVLLVDVADPALTEALSKIRGGLERAVERGTLTDHQAGAVLATHPSNGSARPVARRATRHRSDPGRSRPQAGTL